jgi:hypothetical protein
MLCKRLKRAQTATAVQNGDGENGKEKDHNKAQILSASDQDGSMQNEMKGSSANKTPPAKRSSGEPSALKQSSSTVVTRRRSNTEHFHVSSLSQTWFALLARALALCPLLFAPCRLGIY